MEYFRDEKDRLVTQKQYEAALNRLSPIEYWTNYLHYKYNIRYAMKKIQGNFKKGLPVCFIEYHKIKPSEVKDIVARLNYLGYTINSIYIPYGTSLTASFWVRFDNNKKGIYIERR